MPANDCFNSSFTIVVWIFAAFAGVFLLQFNLFISKDRSVQSDNNRSSWEYVCVASPQFTGGRRGLGAISNKWTSYLDSLHLVPWPSFVVPLDIYAIYVGK